MLPAAVRRIAHQSPSGRVSLVGYCMGGLVTAIYAALHLRTPPDAVVCLATPVDFSKMGLFSVWTDKRYFDVDALVDRLGNVPAAMLRRAFAQWENKLMRDQLVVGGKPVRLGAIRRPFLHVVANRDHIVPLDAAPPLLEIVGSDDKEQIVLEGGHVGIVAGRRAVKGLWPRVAQWLAERSSP